MKTSLSQIKSIALLSFPLVLSYLVYYGKSVVDTVMVGHVDKNNLAGMSLAGGVYLLLMFFIFGTTSAKNAILSEKFANKDFDGIKNSFHQMTYVTLIIAFVLFVIFRISFLLFNLFDLEQQTIDVAYGYLKAMSWCCIISAFSSGIISVLRAIEKNKYLLVVAIAAFILNIPLNYLFIFKLEMGAVGSAYATVISGFVELLMFIYFISRTEVKIFNITNKPDLKRMKTIFYFGLPITIAILIEESLFVIIGFLLARFGEIEVATNQVLYTILAVIFMIPLGISHVVTQKIAYYRVKNDISKVKEIVYSSMLLSLISAFTICLILCIFGKEIVNNFSSDTEIVQLSASLIVLVAFYHLFDTLQMISIGVLRGYKKNRLTMFIAIGCYWFLAIGIGHLLSLSHGIHGYWIGILVGFIIAAIISGTYVYKLVWVDDQ